MAKMVWLFYFSKIFEFIDTMIMVFKKNNRQISFLHVYHHSSIFTIWWLVTLVAPNGEGKKYWTSACGNLPFFARRNCFRS
jgi:elongation of very long chain fatty acids protein 4